MKQLSFKIDVVKELTGNQVKEAMLRNRQVKFQEETNKNLSKQLQMENYKKRQKELLDGIFG